MKIASSPPLASKATAVLSLSTLCRLLSATKLCYVVLFSQIRTSMRILALKKKRQRSRIQGLSAITTLIMRISLHIQHAHPPYLLKYKLLQSNLMPRTIRQATEQPSHVTTNAETSTTRPKHKANTDKIKTKQLITIIYRYKKVNFTSEERRGEARVSLQLQYKLK